MMSDRIAELKERIEKLESENAKLREQANLRVQTQARVAGFAASSAVRILMSPELTDSIRAWLEARRQGDPAPIEETADLLAAIVRRFIRMGLVGAVIAMLPMMLFTWQNVLIREQNAKIQTQIDRQAEDTLILRRAELLDTIYTEECIEVSVEPARTENADEDGTGNATLATQVACKPKAHERARREAAQTFILIENKQGTPVVLNAASIPGAKLGRANLAHADLRDANLAHADLRDANLYGADLTAGNLTGANLHGANLTEVTLTGADLFGATLRRTTLTGADLTSADFGADVSDILNVFRGGADLPRSDLSDADLSNANLRFANLSDADLSNANLQGANLSNTNLRDANLQGADLSNTNFGGDVRVFGADLTVVDVSNANVQGADLTAANLRGVDLSRVTGLTQKQINFAKGDHETKLPDGLARPEHWKHHDP